ncbi:hypothetical protein LXL04_004151 [Taraxacum kok-saghyz]
MNSKGGFGNAFAVVEVYKATIGAYPFAIRGLVTLLKEGGGHERRETATALYALCSFPDNRRRAVECGAVEISLISLSSGLERAVEVLGLLAKCKRGRDEMISASFQDLPVNVNPNLDATSYAAHIRYLRRFQDNIERATNIPQEQFQTVLEEQSRNVQSNNITHASLKTNSKQASTNDLALPHSVYCLGTTAFRLHVSALLPSDYLLGVAAVSSHIRLHHNNKHTIKHKSFYSI